MKIKGIKKASSESKSYCTGYYSPNYLQLNYNTSTGECWTDRKYSLGHNSWTVYNDKSIVNCGIIYEPATMQAIKRMIVKALEQFSNTNN